MPSNAQPGRTIRAALVERRRELQISQREVGRRAGFGSGDISLYESEAHEPTLSNLIRWCSALDLKISLMARGK